MYASVNDMVIRFGEAGLLRLTGWGNVPHPLIQVGHDAPPMERMLWLFR